MALQASPKCVGKVCYVVQISFAIGLLIFLDPACAQASHHSVLCNFVSKPGHFTGTPQALKVEVSVGDHQISKIVITPSLSPRRIMIVENLSDSRTHKTLLTTTNYFAESSPASDQLALVDSNDMPSLDIDLQSVDSFSGKLRDGRVLKKITPTGRRALFDAVLFSLERLQKQPQEGDSIFIVSDGLDNSSRATQEMLRDKLFKSRIRVYAMVLASPASSGFEEKERLLFLDTVVGTGGTSMAVIPVNSVLLMNPSGSLGHAQPQYDFSRKRLAEIQKAVEAMHQLIEKPQKIEFDIDPPLVKPEELKLTISPESPQQSQDMQVLCPHFVNP